MTTLPHIVGTWLGAFGAGVVAWVVWCEWQMRRLDRRLTTSLRRAQELRDAAERMKREASDFETWEREVTR